LEYPPNDGGLCGFDLQVDAGFVLATAIAIATPTCVQSLAGQTLQSAMHALRGVGQE
jgi:hypothetical protein